jgi:hypothetical protein
VDNLFQATIIARHDNARRQTSDLILRVTHVGPTDMHDLQRFQLKKAMLVMVQLQGSPTLDEMIQIERDRGMSVPEDFQVGKGTRVYFSGRGILPWDGKTTTKKNRSPIHQVADFDPDTFTISFPVMPVATVEQPVLTLEYARPSLVEQAVADVVTPLETMAPVVAVAAC